MLLALPKMIEDCMSGLFAPVLLPFDHRLSSHGTKFLFKAHPAHAQYFLEQLKSPSFNFLKKLPINYS